MITTCIIISGYNIDNPDYVSYSNRFDWANYPTELTLANTLDLTYKLFQAVCKDLGVTTYSSFRVILSITIYLIMGGVISRYCVYRNPFFVIYSLFYLPLDLIQIRNFFAFIVLLPFLLGLNLGKKNDIYWYLLGLGLACSIHFSIGLCIIFGLIGVKSKHLKVLFIILFLLLLMAAAPILKMSAAMDKVSGYTQPSMVGGLYMCSWLGLNYLLMDGICKRLGKNNYTISHYSPIAHSINPSYISQINFLLLFLSPLIFMNGSALRIFRFVSLINIMFLLNELYNVKTKSNKFSIVVILCIYGLFFGGQYIYSDSSVTSSIFNNSILE